MKKRLWLVTALLGTLTITGVTWSVLSTPPTPRPVAIMRQHRTDATSLVGTPTELTSVVVK